MKKIKLNLLWSLLLIMVMMTNCTKVPAGYVGVKVYLLGNDGVDSEVITVGRHYVGINEELYLFPTFKQNYVWTRDSQEGSPNDESFTFQTKEGMNVGADIGITFYFQKDKIHDIFQKYRRGTNEITDTFLRNHVRNALNSLASDLPIESVYGTGKAEFMELVFNKVKDEVEEEGIIIEEIYLVNSFRLPNQVVDALNQKVKASQIAQQRERELREAQAQAQKDIAKAEGHSQSLLIKAKAEAEANQIRLRSLTKELLMQQWIEKWDGKLPQVSGSDSPMMLDLSKMK